MDHEYVTKVTIQEEPGRYQFAGKGVPRPYM